MDFPSPAHYFDTLSQARKSYSKALEPLCKDRGLTHNELDVLLFLYNNPSFDRAADIVSHRGIAKSHVSLSVSMLEHRGFLQRQFAPTDRRTAHLQLTPEGQAIAQEGRALQQAFFAKLFQGISPEELDIWQKLIQKVQTNLENN